MQSFTSNTVRVYYFILKCVSLWHQISCVCGDAFPFSRSASRKVSVCKRTEDEETILLLPDPLHEFVGSCHCQGLGPQWTEAEVELEAARHLQEASWNKKLGVTV